MRKKFEPQLKLGQSAIEKVAVPTNSREELPPILEGLRWIFLNHNVRIPVFQLLEKQVVGRKKETGRLGMNLWHILVPGVVRPGLDCNYDRLEDLANHHALIREIMGVAPAPGVPGQRFRRRTLIDNVSIIDEALRVKINEIAAVQSMKLFAGKGPAKPLEVRVDSYVVETNVHYPTDLNLLRDAARKCIALVVPLCEAHGLKGWRKAQEWRARIKAGMRATARVKHSGGARKDERLRAQAQAYLADAFQLEAKVMESGFELRTKPLSTAEVVDFALSGYFHDELVRHIYLVERRMIKGEIIPHGEKVFSLFEPHTRWICKGKLFPPVELGCMVQIATARGGLILACAILENITPDDALLAATDRLLTRFFRIGSLSTDKGYGSQALRDLIGLYVPVLVIPKRGRLGEEDRQREGARSFRALRHRHSAVESDIHCLEHHGLDRCLDKGRRGFGCYVGWSVLAYNLHKIGSLLLKKQAKRHPATPAAA
jgi:hypothetical protein